MPPKKKVELPDHVRKAALADVKLSYRLSIEADESAKIRIYLGTEQGLSTYEIAEDLGVSQPVVSKWSRQGREAYERREEARNRRGGVDPDRSGELTALG